MAQQTLRNTNGSRTAGSIENREPPPPPIFFFLRMFFWTCFDDPLSLLVFSLNFVNLSLGANIFVQDPIDPFCTSGPELG